MWSHQQIHQVLKSNIISFGLKNSARKSHLRELNENYYKNKVLLRYIMRKFFIFIITVMILTTTNCGNKLKILFDDSSSHNPPRSSLVISFQSNRTGHFEIYMIDSDGTNLIQLTNNSFESKAPNWSPDGNKIVFYSNRDGNYEIYAMNSDGNNITRLTNNSHIDDIPVWSPD